MEQPDLRSRVRAVFGHTEITNEDGTGGYIIPGIFSETDSIVIELTQLLKQ